jgi:hypothetical protein
MTPVSYVPSGKEQPMISTEALDRLEHRLTADGLGAHQDDLARVADLVVRTGALPSVAGVLVDPDRPETQRYLALARAMRALRTQAAGSLRAA